jgi:hypothetical protein
MTDAPGKLRLRAQDEEDLKVLSTVLQDAVVSPTDMTWRREEGRFVLVVSRYCWEAEGHRVMCGVEVRQVTGVRRRGFAQSDAQVTLNLLAVARADAAIRLTFSGDAELLIETAAVDCVVRDFGDPWPTIFRPDHGDEAGR